MTVSDVLTDVADALNNEGTSALSVSKRRRALNRALREWSIEVSPVQETFLVNLVVGTTDYTWPDRIIRAWRVTVNTGTGTLERDIPFVAFDDLNLQNAAQGSVWRAAMLGSTLFRVESIPSLAVTGGIKIYADAMPVPIATDGSDDGDTLPYPAIHQEGLVAGTAFYLCQDNIEDPTAALRLPMFEAQWQEAKARAAMYARNPNHDILQVGGRGLRRGCDCLPWQLPANMGRKVY